MSLEPAAQLEHLRLAADLCGLEPPELVLPADHHVVLRGIRLHYLDWGGEGSPTVIFLHGGGLNAHTWDLVCIALRGEYRCIALDQRGHGDSEWSPAIEYGIDDHTGDIERFVDRLGLDRVALVGQSMGAINAIAYASRRCDRVAALVPIDAGPWVRWNEGTERIADFVLAPGEVDSVDELAARAAAFNPLRDPRLLRTSLLHNLRLLPSGKWTWKYDRRLLGERLRELPSLLEDLRGRVASIDCPTLVVRGALSDVFSDGDAAQFAELLPRGRWTRIENAGHTVQGDNPRALVETLRGFLSEVGS
jgi:esterase